MIKTVVAFLYFAVTSVAPYSACAEDKDIAKLFADKNIKGAIVLSDISGLKTYISNEHRASKAFIPASTFKIPNTLMALDKGVVTEMDLIKWDGKKREIEEWNRDQTLETAFKSSCVWRGGPG